MAVSDPLSVIKTAWLESFAKHRQNVQSECDPLSGVVDLIEQLVTHKYHVSRLVTLNGSSVVVRATLLSPDFTALFVLDCMRVSKP